MDETIFFVMGKEPNKPDTVDENSGVRNVDTRKYNEENGYIDLLKQEDALGGNYEVWTYRKDQFVYIDLLSKGITLTVSVHEFDELVQNLNQAMFKFSKQREIELEESCDCERCVAKREGQ